MLLCAAPSSAETFEALYRGGAGAVPAMGMFMRAQAPAADPLGAPLHSIELAPLLNNMRRTSAAFDAGGATVRVFGDKSQNKKSWFVGFSTDGGDTQFRKGEKMLNWMLISREQEVTLNGRVYKVKLHGQLRNRMQSKLTIEPKDKKSGAKASFTIQQLSDSVYDAGHFLRIGGREFRLLYTENFNESQQGEFGGYTGDRSIVLMFRDADGKLKGYHWFERNIPEGRVSVETPRLADEDDAIGAGTLTLGVSRRNGRLELYYPVR